MFHYLLLLFLTHSVFCGILIIPKKHPVVPTRKVWVSVFFKKGGECVKKYLVSVAALLCLLPLSSCQGYGQKTATLSVIYMVTAALALLLLLGGCFLVKKRKPWFLLLFSSVLIVNIGYAWLSVSTSLETALMANRISYLGSVFLPMAMLVILLKVTNTPYKKSLPWLLIGLALLMFLIAASPGILDIYYKEVSFSVVDGVSVLNKVYGPLHPIYLVYLLGYFTAMVAVIIRAQVKKTIDSTLHAIILAAAVLVNIGVWFVEQMARIDYELLSVSYIISELFLLGVHLVMNENQRLRELVKRVDPVRGYVDSAAEYVGEPPVLSPEQVELYLQGLERLTPTERTVYDAYMARATTKEVLNMLGITENTLKYHNRNLYGKLGVNSRKELLEMHKFLNALKSDMQK